MQAKTRKVPITRSSRAHKGLRGNRPQWASRGQRAMRLYALLTTIVENRDFTSNTVAQLNVVMFDKINFLLILMSLY